MFFYEVNIDETSTIEYEYGYSAGAEKIYVDAERVVRAEDTIQLTGHVLGYGYGDLDVVWLDTAEPFTYSGSLSSVEENYADDRGQYKEVVENHLMDLFFANEAELLIDERGMACEH